MLHAGKYAFRVAKIARHVDEYDVAALLDLASQQAFGAVRGPVIDENQFITANLSELRLLLQDRAKSAQ